MDGAGERDRLREAAEEVSPVLGPVALVFKRMLGAFERDVGISPPKYFVLHMVAREEGISQGDLGRVFGVDPSRITRLAKMLEGEGLIERYRDPGDNRVVRMQLTPEGRRVFGEAAPRREAFERRIGRALDEEEVGELRRLLGALAEVLEG
ncbi:transcriptional regulator, MarR family [Rubrobacter xylanophilus DSM 9941]|uniref:Transcriptional regulator, MarR family n=1 Tax=Rubrobacter xylanophilus (strain DSM 9941 / JCM 11954 / NBRC 16129 / PRD-1) TaxID=266117 RepID=Q1AYE4_RUBXD|nr:MarR family transcriptional regulator [Rubrobacter xylanophilus]ABG03584.1 transcriptional regulator, MarR family [Rubrobacter xylanophilus DSM 9941]